MPRIPPSRENSPTNTQSSSLSCSDPIGTQDTERHGEVEAGALLANVCRREVHGNVRRWDVVAAGAQRGADAILTLTDGGIRQADGMEVDFVQFYAGDVNFNFDDIGFDTVDCRAESLVDH